MGCLFFLFIGIFKNTKIFHYYYIPFRIINLDTNTPNVNAIIAVLAVVVINPPPCCSFIRRSFSKDDRTPLLKRPKPSAFIDLTVVVFFLDTLAARAGIVAASAASNFSFFFTSCHIFSVSSTVFAIVIPSPHSFT